MCDIRCLKAKTPKNACKCECKGLNHGVLSDKKVVKMKTKDHKITVELENGSILVFNTFEEKENREQIKRVKQKLNELLLPQLQNPAISTTIPDKSDKTIFLVFKKNLKQETLDNFLNDIKVV